MSTTTPFAVRTIAVIVSLGIHLLAIYLIPGELRKLIVEIIRAVLKAGEEGVKSGVVSAGLAGVFLLTTTGVFAISVIGLTNILLEESNSPIPDVSFIMTMAGVFFLVMSAGLIFHFMETSYSKETENLEEFIDQNT